MAAMTKKEWKAAHAAFWCQCGNPSGDVTFYEDDSRSKVCTKHHYRCNDCGKVVQVG